MKTMNDLFLHFLQDIYYAEKAFAKTAPRILKAVQNEEVLQIVKKAKGAGFNPEGRVLRVVNRASGLFVGNYFCRKVPTC